MLLQCEAQQYIYSLILRRGCLTLVGEEGLPVEAPLPPTKPSNIFLILTSKCIAVLRTAIAFTLPIYLFTNE